MKLPTTLANAETIECPICGWAMTHHSEVEVFQRRGEDTPGMRVAVSYDLVVHPDDPLMYNPSPRRNAIRIEMYCEQEHAFYLKIAQHKGQTLVWAEE